MQIICQLARRIGHSRRSRGSAIGAALATVLFGFVLCSVGVSPRWNYAISDTRKITAGPVGVGSRFRLVTRFFGRRIPLDYEIIDWCNTLRCTEWELRQAVHAVGPGPMAVKAWLRRSVASARSTPTFAT